MKRLTNERLKAAAPLAARLALAAMGVGILVVGLRAAWLTKSATAAVVVGALFVVLAFIFTRDLERLIFRFRDTEVEYQRTAPAHVVQLERIAVSLEAVLAEGPAAVAEEEVDPILELDRVRREVGGIATEVARAASEQAEAFGAVFKEEQRRTDSFAELRADYLRQQYKDGWAGEGATMQEWFETRIAAGPYWQYAFNPQGIRYSATPGAPYISASMRWWGDWRILGIVNTPHPTELAVQRVFFGSLHMQGNNFHFSYPSAFASAPRLSPGTYVFKWARVGAPTIAGWEPAEILATDYVELTPEMFEASETIEAPVRRE